MTMTDTSTEYDPYALSSGLIDDFDGTITEAYFGTDAGYNNGDTVLLILELATDDADRPQETLKLSTGTGWVVEDQGRKIVSESGKNRSFNKNSVVGYFLGCALASGAAETMRGKGIPMEAGTWQGLSFHFNRVEVEGFDGTKKERLVPTKFLGAGTSTATNTTSSTSTSDEVSAGLRAQLVLAAKQASDQSDFIDRAFQIAGVTDSTAAVALATSDEFYAENKA